MALALWLGGVGKGEGLEAGTLYVNRAILEERARSFCPLKMDSAGEDTEYEGVLTCDVDELVVRQNGGVEEDEKAVFRCLRSRNVPR